MIDHREADTGERAGRRSAARALHRLRYRNAVPFNVVEREESMKAIQLHAYMDRQICELGQMAREFGQAYLEMADQSACSSLRRTLLGLVANASEHLRHLGQAGLTEVPTPRASPLRVFDGTAADDDATSTSFGDVALIDLAGSAQCLLHFQLAFLEATHAVASQLGREQTADQLLSWLDDTVEAIAVLSEYVRNELAAAGTYGLRFAGPCQVESTCRMNGNGTGQMHRPRFYP
jgi:hypothetical protein